MHICLRDNMTHRSSQVARFMPVPDISNIADTLIHLSRRDSGGSLNWSMWTHPLHITDARAGGLQVLA
jgi:hypothetical protein